MQRKRGRSPTPRRRRRQRQERERQRDRQQRRHEWTVHAGRTKATTETSSRRPLRAPWQRRPMTPPRPSSIPATAAASSSCEVPPRPDAQMGDNVIWWSELIGLNDPMNNSVTVLSDQTVETIISNIREMTVEHRAYMLSELIPFLGALMAELLRAIATAIQQSQNEVVAVPVDDEDEAVHQCSMIRQSLLARGCRCYKLT